jgi:peptidyl-prolyl cis-trans isomerase-like 4
MFELLHGAAAAAGFENEFRPHLRHNRRGTVSMVSGERSGNGSQFLVTLSDSCAGLDDRHTVFGSVVLEREGDGGGVWPAALSSLNAVLVDGVGRPFVDVRILRTHVLVDPFEDPRGLAEMMPPASPTHVRPPAETVPARLAPEEADAIAAEAAAAAAGHVPSADEAAARKEAREAQEAASRAVLLEMTGDLPSADSRPPESALFVCKLNPLTAASDLELIFSRFGDITQCDIVRDVRTGASLCYGFVVFAARAAAEAAYMKMDNVLIDDRRIRVDFSQSVAGSRAWSDFKNRGKAAATATAAPATKPAVDGNLLLANILQQVNARRAAQASASARTGEPAQQQQQQQQQISASSRGDDHRHRQDGGERDEERGSRHHRRENEDDDRSHRRHHHRHRGEGSHHDHRDHRSREERHESRKDRSRSRERHRDNRR